MDLHTLYAPGSKTGRIPSVHRAFRPLLSPKVRARATSEELEKRAEARRRRCLELKAIVAAEAEARGGRCEHPGCNVEWAPGTLRNPNPLHWHHRQPLAEAKRPYGYYRISELVARPKTTDRELKAELKRCALLCRAHHKEADVEKRGRIQARKRQLAKGMAPGDLERLLAAPNIRQATGLRWRLVMELMARCGLRVSEVCNLTIRDLHQEDDWKIEIRDSKTGDRVVYLPPEVEPLMMIWLGRRTAEFPRSRWLFPTATGGRLSRGNVADMLDRMAARAGIPDTHPHALRHTFSTEFIRKGGNVADLQEILGHTTATMSLRYAKSNPERVRAVLRRKAA